MCVVGKNSNHKHTQRVSMHGTDPHVGPRGRHRYEVNPNMVAALEEAGMRFVGKSDDGKRMEVVELTPQQGQPPHPYFVACQFHPEFKSRPNRPSPLFLGLVGSLPPMFSLHVSCNPTFVACQFHPKIQVAAQPALTALPGPGRVSLPPVCHLHTRRSRHFVACQFYSFAQFAAYSALPCYFDAPGDITDPRYLVLQHTAAV